MTILTFLAAAGLAGAAFALLVFVFVRVLDWLIRVSERI